jgi:hypothetical protein
MAGTTYTNTLPALDVNICGNWTELDVNYYNKLPFYFAKAQAENRQKWQVWTKFFPKIDWKPNMGTMMRSVMVEPSPVIRQFANPNTVQSTPLVDISNVRERIHDDVLAWQDFMSPTFNFLPSFQDFMVHIEDNQENLDKQMEIYADIFYRGQALAQAPWVYVAGYGLIPAPTAGIGSGDPTSATAGKTAAWLQGVVSPALLAAQPGILSFQEVWKALNAFEQRVGATPYEGSGKPGKESYPLEQMYCLVTSGEAWNNFTNDPWLKENRPLVMNIVSDKFYGPLFGRVVTHLEWRSLRASLDANGAWTFPQPETINLAAGASDYNRTIPNPIYADPQFTAPGSNVVTGATIEIGFLIGGKSHSVIDAGPPPEAFASGGQNPRDFVRMNWNGKSYITKNVLVPCTTTGGTTVFDANSFGRYLRIQGTRVFGMAARNPQNVLPIIYKRQFALTTLSN